MEDETIMVGGDKVVCTGHKIYVHARCEMDWPIREFSRPVIYVRGQRLYLAAKRKAEPPYAMCYELWPWPENVHDRSPHTITYDEGYVAERDADFKTETGHARLRMILVPIYPLLGFLWAGSKERVLVPCGFQLRRATYASIGAAMFFCFMELIYLSWLRDGLLVSFFQNTALTVIDCLMLIVLLADSGIRGAILQGGNPNLAPGLLEWLVPRRPRR
jgi:hypothetical protein